MPPGCAPPMRSPAPVGGAPVEPPAALLPLGQALAWAFLGGLILNLMPCVFPILAMKAMALARLSGAARATVRAHAASYTAGVLVTFLALAGLLIGLRAGRHRRRLGLPVHRAGLRRRPGLADAGGRAEPVGRLCARRTGRAPAGRWRRRAAMPAASSPGRWRCWSPRPAPRPSWRRRSAPRWPCRPPATLLVFAALGLGLAAPYALLGLCPGAGGAAAAAGRLDGGAAPGAGLPDVCRRGLAGLGAGAAGRAGRAVLSCSAGRCCSASPPGRFGQAQRRAGGGRLAGRVAAGLMARCRAGAAAGADRRPARRPRRASAETWSASRASPRCRPRAGRSSST